MAGKPQKTNKKSATAKGHSRRQELCFETAQTFIDKRAAMVGFAGTLLLGTGVMGLWGLDTAHPYGAYLLSAGGLGLGIALWFAQPRETAVLVGDGGIAVVSGSDTTRVAWHAMTSFRVEGNAVTFESKTTQASFSLGANLAATAWALKEAAERVPQVLNVAQSVAGALPQPNDGAGTLQHIVDDQVAGRRCAASKTPIHMEADARCCARCGQVYDKSSVPERCVTCNTELKGRTLSA